MVASFQKILFATDLSQNAWHSFEYAVSLAASYGVQIRILHVLRESVPQGYKSLLGEILGGHYQTLQTQREDQARAILIGKEKQAHRIQTALQEWFKNRILDAGREGRDVELIEDIIVKEGRQVPEEIVQEAGQNSCDLIVMGMSSWSRLFRSKASSTITRVIQEAGIPVFVAPMPRQTEQ